MSADAPWVSSPPLIYKRLTMICRIKTLRGASAHITARLAPAPWLPFLLMQSLASQYIKAKNSSLVSISLNATAKLIRAFLCLTGIFALPARFYFMDPQSPSPAGDVNRGTTFIVLAVVFGFLSTATTAVRISIRALSRQLGWDDLAIVLASSLVMIELVFNGLQYHTGDGRHMYYLSESQVLKTLKWGYITEFFLFFIICFTKISICLFVLRIKNNGWLKWCLYTLMAGLVITTLLCEVILFAQCRPIHAFWNRDSGTCWDPVIYNNAIWAQVGMYGVPNGPHLMLIRSQLILYFPTWPVLCFRL